MITVSALADTDGKPGALGGHRCFSWGSYDSDDTYANFSNYGSDVDVIAPGKCIWSTKPGSTYGYSSGTSMATPAVTGAAALYKASRPKATPAEVREALQYLGNLNWKTSTDPDSYHEKLLDVSKLGVLGTFSLSAPTVGVVPEAGGPRRWRSRSTELDVLDGAAVGVGIPAGWTAHLDRTSVFGWTAKSARLNVTAPASVAAGTYEFTIHRDKPGPQPAVVAEVTVGTRPADGPGADLGTAQDECRTDASSAPRSSPGPRPMTCRARSPVSRASGVVMAATRPARSPPRPRFGPCRNLAFNSSYQFRVRARDAAGNWSTWAATTCRTK